MKFPVAGDGVMPSFFGTPGAGKAALIARPQDQSWRRIARRAAMNFTSAARRS
ncbi:MULTISPECIES: hypothetical protein [Paraburkholderia]|uniref:hypothetical protein n=1 Tax=Paraburkholderia TaxID=1822464 RepID=UPI001655AC8C|nr:hypothetical protein [Paraburkholderia podalyriae]